MSTGYGIAIASFISSGAWIVVSGDQSGGTLIAFGICAFLFQLALGLFR